MKEIIKLYSPTVVELVRKMYENPELGREEFEAMKNCCEVLRQAGFQVSENYIEETGFLGEYDTQKPGPTISFLCEYDALPEVGHGCGHNLIAGISILAGIALKSSIENIGGKILVIGTPAEENFGGKVTMAEAGIFEDIDVALMIHPSTENRLGGRTNAINPLKFEFFGKNAHGCRPQDGRSALDAAVLAYMNINLLRQFAEPNTYIHGIIREGGEAANVIPAYASMEYYFRGSSMAYVEELSKKAIDCASAAALATGCRVEVSVYETPYDDMKINYTLCSALKKKYEALGIENIKAVNENPQGSSDIGAVSYRCPALHGYIQIADSSVTGHSKEMADATISLHGVDALEKGALALAQIGYDCIVDKEFLKEVKDEFTI